MSRIGNRSARFQAIVRYHADMVGFKRGVHRAPPGTPYMLVGPGAVWPTSGVPKPDFWMQQLA